MCKISDFSHCQFPSLSLSSFDFLITSRNRFPQIPTKRSRLERDSTPTLRHQNYFSISKKKEEKRKKKKEKKKTTKHEIIES